MFDTYTYNNISVNGYSDINRRGVIVFRHFFAIMPETYSEYLAKTPNTRNERAGHVNTSPLLFWDSEVFRLWGDYGLVLGEGPFMKSMPGYFLRFPHEALVPY